MSRQKASPNDNTDDMKGKAAQILTRSLLNRLGYRKSKADDFYWKSRKVRQGTSRATVQVMFVGNSLCDVTALESGPVGGSNFSQVRTVAELRRWEQFAFPN